MGLDTKTCWLTDRQTQCDFDFDFDYDFLVVEIQRFRIQNTRDQFEIQTIGTDFS
jgi:hypothetical protein